MVSASARATSCWVHPRAVRGNVGRARFELPHGSSPRVRGGAFRRRDRVLAAGYIPARAGYPTSKSASRAWSTVHPRWRGAEVAGCATSPSRLGCVPRVRGEDWITPSRLSHCSGSSPRVRGGLLKSLHCFFCGGCIPASAGLGRRYAWLSAGAAWAVYPARCCLQLAGWIRTFSSCHVTSPLSTSLTRRSSFWALATIERQGLFVKRSISAAWLPARSASWRSPV